MVMEVQCLVPEFQCWEKPFVVVSYGRRQVKGTQPGWEGTSASSNVGKTCNWYYELWEDIYTL